VDTGFVALYCNHWQSLEDNTRSGFRRMQYVELLNRYKPVFL